MGGILLQNRFNCSPAEYEFAQHFSMAGGSSKGNKNNAYIGCLIIPIVWISVFAVLTIGSSVLPGYASVFEWINGLMILLGIVAAGFVFIRKVYFTSNHNIPVDKNVPHIEYLFVNEKGIGINLYNNLEDAVLPFFEWKDINSLHIGFTRDLQVVFAQRRYRYMRETFIAKLNQKYHHLMPFDNQDVYFDRYTLIINKDYGIKMNTAYIQIPKSWMSNGTFSSLIHSIRTHSTHELKPFAFHEEPVHILERLHLNSSHV